MVGNGQVPLLLAAPFFALFVDDVGANDLEVGLVHDEQRQDEQGQGRYRPPRRGPDFGQALTQQQGQPDGEDHEKDKDVKGVQN